MRLEERLTKFIKTRLESHGWNLLWEPSYSTSAKGWDLVMKRGKAVLAIEAKYANGPKLAFVTSFMAAMLSNREKKVENKGKPRDYIINERAWAFNLDRFGHGGRQRGESGTYYEYGIYFCEQISQKKTARYWLAFLDKINRIFFIDGKDGILYETEPEKLLKLSTKFIERCKCKDITTQYLSGKKAENQEKSKFFEDEILSHMHKLVREEVGGIK
jgi:hypothetical protein